MQTLIIVLIGTAIAQSDKVNEVRWEKLPNLPDREGFAGPFAGVSGEILLVAGGANFPDRKPWEGGKKVWYDTVFALERPQGKWSIVGKLPRPLGYGVSVNHRNGVICVGGSDAGKHYAETYRLELRSGKLIITALPPLPLPVANACGTLVGNTLYLAGGQDKPDAKESLKKVFTLDLDAKNPQWREIPPWPGPGRILAVAAEFDGAFWVMGGTDLLAGEGEKVERRYLRDAYRYDPEKGWKRVADLPRAIVAAPSPTLTTESGPVILGGDDGSQIGGDPERHRGFSNLLLQYDRKTNRWIEGGKIPAPRVTVPLVPWQKMWVIPGGETRPGVRSPEVWSAHCLVK